MPRLVIYSLMVLVAIQVNICNSQSTSNDIPDGEVLQTLLKTQTQILYELKSMQDVISDMVGGKVDVNGKGSGHTAATSVTTTTVSTTTTTPIPKRAFPLAQGPCDKGWLYLNETNNCYLLDTTVTKNWEGAKMRCGGMSSHLVSINSKVELEFLQSLSSCKSNSYWTGGIKGDCGWAWHFGDYGPDVAMTYQPWLPGQPNQGYQRYGNPGGNRVKFSIRPGGSSGLETGNGYSFLRSICKKSADGDPRGGDILNKFVGSEGGSCTKQPEELQTFQVQGPCGDGWIHFDGSCFHLDGDPKPWLKARTECTELNAHLLSLDSLDKVEYFRNFSRAMGGHEQNYWIGGMENYCTWFWDMGTLGEPKVMEFSYWRKGEPNDANSIEDHAMLVMRDDHYHGMDDRTASHKYKFICERPAPQK